MKITILGAGGGEVTGSAYLVQTKSARVLVDCGMFQGGQRADTLNRAELPQPTDLHWIAFKSMPMARFLLTIVGTSYCGGPSL